MTRTTFLTLGLLAAFILSACIPNAPAPTPTPTIAAEPAAPEPAPAAEIPTVASAPAADTPVVEEAPIEEPAIVVTPRGNDLEATDPSAVNLTSGKPQLIEFFAFW